MTARLWILGDPDVEMAAIEKLLLQCGERVAYALDDRGLRAPGESAYHASAVRHNGRNTYPDLDALASPRFYLVECEVNRGTSGAVECVRIDHHRPGDPGYGRPPSEFLAASSLGQVIAELAKLGLLPWPSHRRQDYACDEGDFFYGSPPSRWEVVTAGHDGPEARDFYLAIVPRDIVVAAAADHCFGAACMGRCPGVDPLDAAHYRSIDLGRF